MIPSAPSVHSARKSPGAHRLCGHPERARHAHPPQARTRDASWNREPRRRPPAFPDPRTPAAEALSQLPVGPSAAGTCSFRPRSPAHGGGSTARLSGRGFSEVVGLAAIARTQCARSQSESGAVAGAAADHLPVCDKRLYTSLVLRGGRSAHRTSHRAAPRSFSLGRDARCFDSFVGVIVTARFRPRTAVLVVRGGDYIVK